MRQEFTPLRTTGRGGESITVKAKKATRYWFVAAGAIGEAMALIPPLDTMRSRITWHLEQRGSTRDQQTSCYPAFIPSEVGDIVEPAALNMITSLQCATIVTPDCPTGVSTCFYDGRREAIVKSDSDADSSNEAKDRLSFQALKAAVDDAKPVVLLLHGFDSSCLEWRRLVPRLEAQFGLSPVALDVLGWGFTTAVDSPSASARAKREHLHAFWQQHLGGRPLVLVGASLGGAIALDFAAAYPESVKSLVLVDAQGFIDGPGPLGSLPRPLARWGVRLLGSRLLRRLANDLSYFDKATFATEDAVRVGRLHVLADGWEEANLDYMLTGGFKPRTLVPAVACPTLVLWGSEDRVLPMGFAQRFVDEMPDCSLTMIPDCGHVPHLEKPEVTARAIAQFLLSDRANEC